MPKGIKGFQKGHKHSEDTKIKIGIANSKPIYFYCDYCNQKSKTKQSAYSKKKRHFCSMKCYATFQRVMLPKEEHNSFGHGHNIAERELRKKARTILNHAIRDGKIKRLNCCICSKKAEAHHDDYSKPLDVKWLCFKHHRIYENPELLETKAR